MSERKLVEKGELLTKICSFSELGNLNQLKALIDPDNANSKNNNNKIVNEICPNKNGKFPIFLAIEKSREDIVHYILSLKEFDKAIATKEVGYATHVAAKFNQVNILKVLLNNGFALDQKNKYEKTPFLVAINSNSYEAASNLLAEKTNCNILDNQGLAAIHYIANNLDKKFTNLIASNEICNINVIDTQGNNLIYYAIQTPALAKEYLEYVLLLKKINIDQQDLTGKTIAHHLAIKNSMLFSFWLGYKPNLILKDNMGKTVEDYVNESNNPSLKSDYNNYLKRSIIVEVAKNSNQNLIQESSGESDFILNYISENIIFSGTSVGHIAASLGFTKALAHLIDKKKFDINSLDENNDDLLNASIIGPKYGKKFNFNYTEINYPEKALSDRAFNSFKFILNHQDFKLSSFNKDGLKSNHLVVKESHMVAFEELVMFDNQTIIAKDIWGRTPMHHAALQLDLGWIKLILTKSQEKNIVNIYDDENKTPAHYIIESRNSYFKNSREYNVASDILHYLIEEGASLTTISHSPNLLLHKAAYADNLAAIDFLLINNFGKKEKDLSNKYPYEYCSSFECYDLLSLPCINKKLQVLAELNGQCYNIDDFTY